MNSKFFKGHWGRMFLTLILSLVLASTITPMNIMAGEEEDYEYEDWEANPNKNQVLVPSPVAVNKSFTCTFLGDRQKATSPEEEDERYVPRKWELICPENTSYNTFGALTSADVSQKLTIKNAGAYSITITFLLQWYDSEENTWDNDGDYATKSADFIVGGKLDFQLNEGTLPAGTPTYYDTAAKISSIPKPVRDGWYFSGWYKNSDGGSLSSSSKLNTLTYSAGVAFIYAHWHKEFPLVKNWGYGTKAEKGDVRIDIYANKAKHKAKIEWTDFGGVKSYTVYQKQGKKKFKKVKTIKSNKSFKSNYSSLTYTVKNLKKGSKYQFKVVAKVKASNQIYKQYSYDYKTLTKTASKIIDGLVPERPGYVFADWYTELEGGVKIAPSGIVLSTPETITVYAHWTKAKPKYKSYKF